MAALARGRIRTVGPRKLKQPVSKCVGVDGNIRNKIIKIKSVDSFFLGGGGQIVKCDDVANQKKINKIKPKAENIKPKTDSLRYVRNS